jgi:hypothetical protein
MASIKFEIEQNIGTISEGAKEWKKELNLISWNGREAKYDFRDWGPDYEKNVKRHHPFKRRTSHIEKDIE